MQRSTHVHPTYLTRTLFFKEFRGGGHNIFLLFICLTLFFSVPVDKDSQYWFAFLFDGKSYTFTRLGQGFVESPTIYNEALRESLESLTLSPGSALLQYVDDCLIASPTKAM